MKLTGSDFKSAVVGAEKELNFSIDTESSVIFDILRDKMYTNKIAAVCREVASNSRDANIEAGRSEMPIKISIVEPFELDCISDKSIVFGDNGPGITPDRMADIFVKYAASTKRSNNDQVGGFGLGVKTPFAYSDTFTVITVCDVETEKETKRMRFVYTAMIDDSQKGKMILFDSESSTEETGTQIVVPIGDADKSSFEKEVAKYTCLWDVKPILEGFQYSFAQLKDMLVNKNLWIVEDEDRLLGAPFVALLEGIPYPINTMDIADSFESEARGFVLNGLSHETPIVLKFKTGDLSVSANREGIHYTIETKESIVEMMKSVIVDFTESFEEYIGGESTYLESCIKLNEMNQSSNSDYSNY